MPSFDTLVDSFLFCIAKGPTGFKPVPEGKARRQLRQGKGQGLDR
jgi:hypothetical protein